MRIDHPRNPSRTTNAPARSLRWRRLVALAAVVALGLSVAGHADRADDAARLPGKRVLVDGHRIYLDCEGTVDAGGGATVVFDAGLGDSSLVWSRVQPAIARVTRACSYDRPGYGASDARLPPRTSSVIVHELRALLGRAGVEPPYVLVGHSFGGWNMQLFASTWPDRVAALVLVDSSQVGEIKRYRQQAGVNIAPTGDFRLTPTPFVPPDLPPSQAARARDLTYNPVTWRTAHNELVGFRDSERQVAEARPLPAVPIMLLSRGEPINGDDPRSAKRERLWRQLQQQFVDRHPGTVHVIAHASGHYIQLQQPGLVIRAICGALRVSGHAAKGCRAQAPPEKGD